MENVDQFFKRKKTISDKMYRTTLLRSFQVNKPMHFFYHLDYYNMDHIQSFKTR